MTCAEARESFSARADDALSTAERAALDAHLAGCPECRREWQRFAATVSLLRAVEPARAPAGFVDRVLAAAPRPWYRRAARGLLLPWPVKLPLEAAALVMVAGLAVLIFERSPELQRAANVPVTTTAPSGAGTPASPPPLADKTPLSAADETRAVATTDARAAGAPSTTLDAGRPETAPPRVAEPQADQPIPARRPQSIEPAQQERPSTATPPPPAAAPAPLALFKSRGDVATTAPPDISAGARAKRAGPPAKEAAMPPAREPKAESRVGQAQQLAAVRVPPSVELSLTAADRAAAERDVTTIVQRLGGSIEPGPAPGTLEVTVPRDAFAALTVELARLGTLRTVLQPAELPDSVRVGLRLAN